MSALSTTKGPAHPLRCPKPHNHKSRVHYPGSRPLNDQRTPGALVHGPRHTYATKLANSNVSVYVLMKLLDHESMPHHSATSTAPEQRTAKPLP
jgi:integrase